MNSAVAPSRARPSPGHPSATTAATGNPCHANGDLPGGGNLRSLRKCNRVLKSARDSASCLVGLSAAAGPTATSEMYGRDRAERRPPISELAVKPSGPTAVVDGGRCPSGGGLIPPDPFPLAVVVSNPGVVDDGRSRSCARVTAQGSLAVPTRGWSPAGALSCLFLPKNLPGRVANRVRAFSISDPCISAVSNSAPQPVSHGVE